MLQKSSDIYWVYTAIIVQLFLGYCSTMDDSRPVIDSFYLRLPSCLSQTHIL